MTRRKALEPEDAPRIKAMPARAYETPGHEDERDEEGNLR